MNQQAYGLRTASLILKQDDPAPFGLHERPSSHLLLVVSGMLAIAGTSSAEPSRLWEEHYVHEFESTTSNPSYQQQSTWNANINESREEDTGHAVSELRRVSGLTWDQLGQLFGVSRRSIHFWASGKPLNAANEARLMRMLDVIHEAYRGDARSTRVALFQVTDGISPFDLLTSERFKEARELLGKGVSRAAEHRLRLSPVETAARRPLTPDQLVGALQNSVHRDKGNRRAAKTVRNKGSDRS